jgi:DNA-binding Xre family transcriptional regulator
MSLAEQLDPADHVAATRGAIASNIRAMMGRRTINQTELGRRLGTSQAWVSRHVNGSVAFTTDELVRVAQALGCDLADLLEGARSR